MKKFLAMTLALVMCFACLGISASAAKKTESLVFWTQLNEGEPLAILEQESIDAYAELHPEVDCEIVYCGRDIITQFQAMQGSKDSDDYPDIIIQKDGTLAPLVGEGLLYCLDEEFQTPAFDQDMTWYDTFMPNLMDCVKQDGKNYFVPMQMYTHGFFYDANQFEQLGIKVPETWDEFITACETLKANGIAPIALDGTVDDYNDWWYIRFAERLAGVDALDKAAAGEVKFADNEAFLKAAQYIQQVVDNGYFQDGAAGSVFPSAQALFVQGAAGMLFCGAWIPTEMSSQTPDTMSMKMFPMPVLPDSVSERHEEIWSNCFAVTADSDSKEIAVDFLKYLSGMDKQEARSAIKNPSPLVGGPKVAELDSMEAQIANATSVSTIYGGTAMFPEWYANVFGPTCTKLITGVLDAEGFIAELDNLTQAFYNK